MVIIQHCAGRLGTNVFTPFGGIGVAMFLVLSGYGLSESYHSKGLDGWIKKKVTRVWLPFFLVYVVMFMLRENGDVRTFVRQVLTIELSEYWYVDFLLRCYLVFYVSYRWLYRCRWLTLITFSLYTFLFSHNGLMSEQALSFAMGIFISEQKRRLLSDRFLTLTCITSLALGISCLAIKQIPQIRELEGSHWFALVQLGIKLPTAIGIIIALWKLPHRLLRSPLLLLSGTISYELYLVHWQMVGMVNVYMVSALAMIIISYCCAYGMNKIQRYFYEHSLFSELHKSSSDALHQGAA